MTDDTTFTPKDVALAVGWEARAYHEITQYNDVWFLHAPNRHVYQDGKPAQPKGGDNLHNPSAIIVYEATGRDTEARAWEDLPDTIDEIVNGWKSTHSMESLYSIGKAVSND